MAHISTIQFYRGSESGLPVLGDGEPGWCIDTFKLYIGQSGVNHLVTAGSGSVTSVTAGAGLTGGTITTTGTIALAGFDALTEAAPADSDAVPFYDASAAGNRRVSARSLQSYVSRFNELGASAVLADDDYLPIYDTTESAGRTIRPPDLAAYLLPPGLIMGLGTSTIPAGWLACDGQAVSRTTYAALYAVVGSTWGPGNGTTTFNVPDFRGRVMLGRGTGTGLTPHALAATGGAETHQLIESELPIHQHGIRSANGTELFEIGGGASANIINTTTFAGSLASYKTQATGAGGSHANMQPWVAVQWIIKT